MYVYLNYYVILNTLPCQIERSNEILESYNMEKYGNVL